MRELNSRLGSSRRTIGATVQGAVVQAHVRHTDKVALVLYLLLVRHGESSWNALGRWQGQADVPLSDRGRLQAAAAAPAIAAEASALGATVRAVVSSTLDRALSTAAILNDHLDAGPLYLDADLIERDAGEWSGLTRAEIEAGFPGYLNDGRRPHGYEADHSVRDRVLGALDRVVARFLRTGNTNNRATDDRPEVVVVVTHGGVIYAVENHLDAPFERKPNLGARFIVASGEGLRLGHSVLLLDAATATSPDLL